MPGDDFLPEHEGQTEQQCQGTHLADGSGTAVGDVTEQQVEARGQLFQHAGVTVLDGPLHDAQRGGTRFGIEIAAELSGHGPGCHLCGEAHQQEAASHQCGVEEIATQTTEGHLAHADGNECTDEDDPDGQVGGQVEAQQQAGEDGGAVGDGVPLVFQQIGIDGPLEEHTGHHACGAHDG